MMNEWRSFAAMPANRAWPGTWAQRSATILRGVWAVGATLGHLTVGLAAVRTHCLLAGHDDGFAREPNRLFLRCATCGRRTNGWAIATSAPP